MATPPTNQEVGLLASTLWSQLQQETLTATPSGQGLSFVTKQVQGKTYWYLQQNLGARQTQYYLGADNEELRNAIAAHKAAWAAAEPTRKRRRQLVQMIEAGGIPMFSSVETRVLQVLEQAGVFRAGGVLVGSYAFRAYGQMFGILWPTDLIATQDIDVAAIKLAASTTQATAYADLREALLRGEAGFVEVPALDRKAPATKFTTRNQNLLVEVLTPMLGRESEQAVHLRQLGTFATPLRFLDYLIIDAHKTTLAAGEGVEVNIPNAAKFAVHKLVVAERRRSSDLAKIKKDVAQAGQVFGVLLREQPDMVSAALKQAKNYGKKFWQQVTKGSRRLDADLRQALRRHVLES